MATADTEPTNNSVNGCADSSFACWLACFRWHDDGASVEVVIVGDRSPPDVVTWHSSINFSGFDAKRKLLLQALRRRQPNVRL
jgi:hypothetical protein